MDYTAALKITFQNLASLASYHIISIDKINVIDFMNACI